MITVSNLAIFTCKINEKTFEFACDPQAQITDAKEALFQYMKYLGQLEDQLKAQAETKAEPVPEEQKTE